MREAALSCLAVLASMVFFSFFWAPYVKLLAHAWADLAVVKGWIWLAGVVMFGAVTAYFTWPQGEAKKY